MKRIPATTLRLYLCCFAFAIVSLSTGCSSKKEDVFHMTENVRDQFFTQIKTGRLKIFTYQAISINSSHKLSDKSFDSQPKKSRPKRRVSSVDKVWVNQVELGLKNTLAMTGFCREGYIELHRYIGFNRAEIRGECEEGATDQDMIKFRPAN